VYSPWLAGPINTKLRSLAAEVTKVESESQTAALAATDAPAILGAEGTRHYLVAFMTPAETRGLGGFVGAYGLLTVTDGHIQLTSSGVSSALRQTPGATHLSGPASYLARYSAFDPADHFQDTTYAKTISEVLGPEVAQGRLLFWSSHRSDQALLDRIGLAGAFPQPGPSSDVLAVTLANAANNKIDAYLHQSTTYTVAYDPKNGDLASTLDGSVIGFSRELLSWG
jgi:hypothetical protein